MIFSLYSFWKAFHIPSDILQDRYKKYFGSEKKTISDRETAQKMLMSVSLSIQKKMTDRIKSESTYGMLLKLYYIFGEVHSYYLKEKEQRFELVKENISLNDDQLEKNRNIQRSIIDSCNIWIENCLLLQHDLRLSEIDVKKEFTMDIDLLIDMYIYGLTSQAISLLVLSKKIAMRNSFYGIQICLKDDLPIEVLKHHPVIYYNPTIVGNQHDLVSTPLTSDANNTEFGKGFVSENKVEFLLWLAILCAFEKDILRNDEKALTVISKEDFIGLTESYTKPSVNGMFCYDSFVLTKEKLKMHLRKDDEIIWIVGANKYRHELRPFIGLEDGNVLINYGALEQAKQLWVSFFSNGGMCYTHPTKKDDLCKAMEKRNEELSDIILVEKLQEILRSQYSGTVDLKNVDYQRIFGEKEKNYGDYDIVFYVASTKELFLIESKYFSDSLNSSGIINDYNKLFGENGYYKHCRERYDLVLAEPEKMKGFIKETNNISVHMLFISSKPIEIEFQDDDGIVTFLSLSNFQKYLTGNLLSEDGKNVIRPIHII